MARHVGDEHGAHVGVLLDEVLMSIGVCGVVVGGLWILVDEVLISIGVWAVVVGGA